MKANPALHSDAKDFNNCYVFIELPPQAVQALCYTR